MRKRGTANFREQTCAVPSVMAGLHEHPGQERGAYGRRKAATPGLPKPAGQRRIAERRTRRPCFPDGRGSVTGQAEGCRAIEDRDSEGENTSPLSRARQSGTHGPRYGPAPPLLSPRQTMPPEKRKAGRPDAGQRTKKDDRLPRGRSSRPKREDVLMVRGYGEGGGCSREPRQDQGGLPCRICCPPKAGRDDLRSKIRRSQEGPAGARGIPGRGRSSRGLHFVERELRLKVPVKGGCCFREPGRKEEELPARYFFLPLAGISS